MGVVSHLEQSATGERLAGKPGSRSSKAERKLKSENQHRIVILQNRAEDKFLEPSGQRTRHAGKPEPGKLAGPESLSLRPFRRALLTT